MADIKIQPHFGGAGLAVPNLPRVDARATGLGVAAGVLGVAAQVTDRLADEQAEREASNAVLAARTQINNFNNGLKGRQDYDQFETEYQQMAEGWKAQNLDGLSVRGRQRVEGRLNELFAAGGETVRGAAWATQVDVSRADLSRFLDESFALIGQDPNGQLAADTLAGIAERISDMEARGFLTAAQAESLRQDARARYGILGATSLIEQDPYGAKRALASGQFDHLISPEKKLQLQKSADAEIKRREAEARARQAQANAEWAAGFEGELAAIAAGQTIAETEYTRENLVARFGAEKGSKLADAYEKTQGLADATGAIMGMSDAQVQQTLAESKAALDAGPEDYREKAAWHQALTEAAVKRATGLATDPGGYVASQFPEVRQAYEAFAATGDPDDLAAATTISLNLQSELGVPAEKQKPLAKSTADLLAKDIAGGNPDKAMTTIGGLLALGDDQVVRQALGQVVEAGAAPEIVYVAQNLRDGNTAAAGRILTAISADAPKLGTEEKKTVEADVAAAYDARSENLWLQAQWTGDPARAQRAQQDVGLAVRITSITGNADQAVADVVGGLQPVTDDEIGAVTMPAGVDPDQALDMMAAQRDALVQPGAFAAALGPEGNPIALQIAEDVADDVREQARWVDYGDGYALVLPGGAFLSDERGGVKVLTLFELMNPASAAIVKGAGL